MRRYSEPGEAADVHKHHKQLNSECRVSGQLKKKKSKLMKLSRRTDAWSIRGQTAAISIPEKITQGSTHSALACIAYGSPAGIQPEPI